MIDLNNLAGYFVHLSTVEEVREQVVHYLPVMARPMVLHQTHHPIIWTPLYADVTVIYYNTNFNKFVLK